MKVGFYIGQTVKTLEGRAGHNFLGYKDCKRFYKALKKYGPENFDRWIFAVVDTQEEADAVERFWIAEMRRIFGIENVYNITDGGEGGRAGIPFSKEHCQNISKSMMGKLMGEKNPNFGHRWSEEQRKIASDKMIGKMDGENNNFYGKTHTKKVKLLLSQQTKENHKNGSYNQKYIETRKVTLEDELKIIDRYLIGDLMIEDICEMFNIGRWVFDGIKERHNVQTIKQPKTEEHKNKMRENIKIALIQAHKIRDKKTILLSEKVIKLRQDGLLQKEIAKELDITQVRVSQILIKNKMRTQINPKRK